MATSLALVPVPVDTGVGVDLAEEIVNAPVIPPIEKPISATAPQTSKTADLVKSSFARSTELSNRLAAEIQTNLGLREQQASVTADAITTIAGADKKIALQTDTENLRVQNQLRRVTEESTSEDNQARLMAQMHSQAQDIQAHLEERQQEADEGGIGYIFKSMLNMEIYGTPGGKDDLELAAKGAQYQATVQELQGITAAVTNFEAANQKTRELVTDATIHSNQQKLTAQANLDLSQARLAMLKDNAEQMQMLFATDRNRLSSLNALLNFESSQEAREDRKLAREQVAESMELRKKQFELSAVGTNLDNQRKALENAVAAGDTGLAIRSKLAIKASQQQLKALTRENLVGDITVSTKIAAAEKNLEIISQQERLNELTLIQAEGTQEQRLNAGREAKLLQAQVAENERTAVLTSAASIGTAQEALYGFKDAPEVLATGVRESGAKGARYDMLEAIGANMVAGNGLSLGDTPYKAWINYQALTSDGSVMRELPFVKSLQEVANRLETKYSDPDSAVQRPDEPEAAAKAFNDEAAAYTKEFSSDIKTGDATNPMQADPFPILEQKAPGLLQDPLYKKIKKTGQVESNPEQALDTAVNSIATKAITLEQAADGIANIYSAVGFNTEFYQYGLEAAGFQVPPAYNVVLPNPQSIGLTSLATTRLKGVGNQPKFIRINLMDRNQVMLYLTRQMSAKKLQGKPTTSAAATQSAVDRAGVNNAIPTPGATANTGVTQ